MTELAEIGQSKGEIMAESDKTPLLDETFDTDDVTFVAGRVSYGSDGGSNGSDKENGSTADQFYVHTGGHTPSIQTSESSQKTTPFVYLLTCMSAVGGFLFGYDTGVVSGAMILLKEEFNLNSLWQELVVSITIGMAAIGAIVGGPLNNKFGRKPVILFASFVFTWGALILGVAYNREMLLAGRAILGIGIGFASMTTPMYIAECAPSHLRGRLVTLNNVFITFGQVVASVVDGIFSYDRKNGWRYMLGFAGIPSLFQFVGFFFMPESPRWLMSKQREQRATKVLSRIRGTTHVLVEVEEIKAGNEANQRLMESRGNTPLIIQALTTPAVRRAIFVGCMLQCFQQISGINTVMYYSATIIRLSGVRNPSLAIWLAAVTASVNFLFTFVGLWLVERIGRRSLTIGSLAGTTFSLALLGVSFQLAAYNSPPVTWKESVPANDTHLPDIYMCSNFSYCDSCMNNVHCGYCYDTSSGGTENGSCLAVPLDRHGDRDTSRSEYGRCQNGDHENTVWAYDFCPTKTAWTATLGLVLYLMFFAPGMGPMPWTINSEIYPLWARSVGNSLSTFTNWTFNLFISMTFLTFTEVLTRYGAFYLYTGFAFVGCIFMYFFLPETKGKKLEEVEQLFEKQWCAKSE